MPRTINSREERTAKLRTIINGQSTTRTGTTKKPCVAENLLFGVMLHAAARHSQGKTLSPLEARLRRTLQTFTDDDEEVAQYGAIFTKAKQQMRANTASANFPQAVLNLGEDDAYTSDALYRDVVALAPEIIAQPNHQIVDLAQIQDEPVDSEAYLSALTAAGGSGVTLFTASESANPETRESVPDGGSRSEEEIISIPIEEVRPVMAASRPYRLLLNQFTCLESSGDAGGSRQEIYWGTASGADGGDRDSQKTKEYGSVNKGSTRDFDYPTILFHGNVADDVTGHIECWEADNSNSAWYKGLRETLSDISQYCADAAELAQGMGSVGGNRGSIDKTVAVLTLASLAFAAMDYLLKVFRNEDDFVQRRDFGWTREGLQWFLNMRDQSASMIFHGGEGRYELRIQRELLASPDFGRLKVAEGTGTSWSPAVNVGSEWSFNSMSMVDCLGNLYGIFTYQSTRNLMITKMNADGSWTTPIWIQDHYAQSRPAPATFGNGDLGIAYRDNENHLRWIRTNLQDESGLTNWEAPEFIASTTAITSDGPAVADYAGYLFVIHRAHNGTDFYCASSNSGGRSWGGNQKLPDKGTPLSRPELGVYNGTLYLMYTGINGDIRVIRYTGDGDSHSWTWDYSYPTKSGCGISAAVHNGDHWYVYRAADSKGTVKLLRSNASNYSKYATNITVVLDPNICSFNGKLYLSFSHLDW